MASSTSSASRWKEVYDPRYKCTTLRFDSTDVGLDEQAAFLAQVDAALNFQETRELVWNIVVTYPLLWPTGPALAQLLREGHQFRLHHVDLSSLDVTWYHWSHPTLPDSFPAYATSKQGVNVVLVDRDGLVCLVRECDISGQLRFSGRLKFLSGGVEVGETVEQAAHREVKEELGLEWSTSECYWLTGYSQAGRQVNDVMTTLVVHLPGRVVAQEKASYVYVETAPQGGPDKTTPLTPQPQEIAQVHWLNEARLREMLVQDPTQFLEPGWIHLLFEHLARPSARPPIQPTNAKGRMDFVAARIA